VPVAESITLDRPPVVTQVPSPTLPATGTITGTSASVTLTWAASDLTPILSYDLFQSTDGGAEVSVFDGDATSAKRHLSFGHTYGYRVGATDSTNQTGTATAPSFSLHLAQQSAAALSGAWTTNTGSTYAGGSDVSATQAGAAATFTFTGRAVSLVGVTGPTHGKLRVYVDGALVKTIDTYHSTVVTRRVLFARGWATGGTHTLAVVCAGTSGRPRIDVDGFVTIQ
jgi:hypothetical protein